MIRFNCPCCQSVLEASEEDAGRMIHCPNTHQLVRVPAAPSPLPGPFEEIARSYEGARVDLDNLSTALPESSEFAEIAQEYEAATQPPTSRTQAIMQRIKREQEQAKQKGLAFMIAAGGVSLGAAVALGVATDLDTLLRALVGALAGSICGAVAGIALGVLAVSRLAILRSHAPRHQVILQASLASTIFGLLIGGSAGAYLGALMAHPELAAGDNFGQAFAGAVIGIVPAGVWWLRMCSNPVERTHE